MKRLFLFVFLSWNFGYALGSTGNSDTIIDKIRGIDSILEIGASDIFGGLYIQKEPELKIALLVTDLSRKDEVKKYIMDPLVHNYLEFIEVKHSFVDLVEAQHISMQFMKNYGVKSDNSILVKENKVVVKILDDNKGKKLTKIDTLRNYKGSIGIVDVQYVKTLSKSFAFSYGGSSLRDESGSLICTQGFNMINPFGPSFTSTAGHCSPTVYFSDAGKFTRVGSPQYSGHSDFQSLSSNDANLGTNAIKTCSGGCLLPITSIVKYTDQVIGETVCKYGETTGNTCGEIVSKTAAPSYVPNVSPGFIEVKPLNAGNMGAPGDSGGPFYSGNGAYGTLSGGDSETGNAFYMRPSSLIRTRPAN